MDEQKINEYLNEIAADESTHNEVNRFIKDFQIKMEFGQFEYEEEAEGMDPFA